MAVLISSVTLFGLAVLVHLVQEPYCACIAPPSCESWRRSGQRRRKCETASSPFDQLKAFGNLKWLRLVPVKKTRLAGVVNVDRLALSVLRIFEDIGSRSTTLLVGKLLFLILRTKEILGDILASTTGMNRGRLRWEDMQQIEVPIRNERDENATAAVAAVKEQWNAHAELVSKQGGYITALAADLKLDGADSRLRWLGNKPPE